MNRMFLHYAPHKGSVGGRTNGVLISTEQGEAVTYGLWYIEERGKLFISTGAKVYEGMIIGQNAKDNDLDVNPLKSKQLTNIRTTSKDEAVKLTPIVPMTLEQAMAYIQDDELVEVTPQNIRLRKRELLPHLRTRRCFAELRQGRIQKGLDAAHHVGREAHLAHRAQPQLAAVQFQYRDARLAAGVAREDRQRIAGFHHLVVGRRRHDVGTGAEDGFDGGAWRHRPCVEFGGRAGLVQHMQLIVHRQLRRAVLHRQRAAAAEFPERVGPGRRRQNQKSQYRARTDVLHDRSPAGFQSILGPVEGSSK
jgi:hypothetical protein